MSLAKTPRQIYGSLFETVQAGRIFSDSKTFVDAVPRHAPEDILRRFEQQRDRPDFDLRAFVRGHFDLPAATEEMSPLPARDDAEAEIERLWAKLTRAPDQQARHSSLIGLPNPYVVPGGRFRELYYWDSYFTMLGLATAGKTQLLQDMVDNFACLIDRIGFIPNGTRSYFCTRSQPPFFVMMIELLATAKPDDAVYQRYLPQLKKEYAFWMAGADELGTGRSAIRRISKVDNTLMNRYWDDADDPRDESYAEDIALASHTSRESSDLFRDIRAACESGWDFSSRWFGDAKSIASICTTDILPVDLNSILCHLEVVLERTCGLSGDIEGASFYGQRAEQRKSKIQSIFFDQIEGFYVDLTLSDRKPIGRLSLAGAYPLFFGLATDDQAASVAKRLEEDFLRPGGWVTTLSETGQQWDAPNGWAPLQWIVFEGLRNYGFDDAARAGAARWIENNLSTYKKTGRFMEKYNVEHPGVAGSGGEYAVQDGFGWTNGVLLCLLKQLR